MRASSSAFASSSAVGVFLAAARAEIGAPFRTERLRSRPFVRVGVLVLDVEGDGLFEESLTVAS